MVGIYIWTTFASLCKAVSSLRDGRSLGLVRILCVCVLGWGEVIDMVTCVSEPLTPKEFHSVESHFQLWVPTPDCAPVC